MMTLAQRLKVAFLLAMLCRILLVGREFSRHDDEFAVVDVMSYDTMLMHPRSLASSSASTSHSSMTNIGAGTQLDFPIPRPDENNTVVALIAMGKISNFWLTERCIHSIRVRGRFQGTVLVITDEKGYRKYSETLFSTPKNSTNEAQRVIVVESRKEDTEPDVSSGVGLQYYKNRPAMLYKRHKTLLLKYAENAFLNNPKSFPKRPLHVLYLDVDNIVAQPLSRFFDDYFHSIRSQWVDYAKLALTADFGFFSFWRDPHMKDSKQTEHLWQSGQMMLSTDHSVKCLEAWRHEMDQQRSPMDQVLLFNVYKQDFIDNKCHFFELPFGDTILDQNKTAIKQAYQNKHFQLLSKEDCGKDPEQFPTIVHLTKMRLERLTKPMVSSVLEKLLLPSNHSKTGLSGTVPSINYNGTVITWTEIIDQFVQLDYRKKRQKARRKKRRTQK